MQENEALKADDENGTKGNYFLKITLTEAVFAVLIIIIALICKFFWTNSFSEFSVWYGENMTSDTDIDEVTGVFSDGGADEI